MPSISRSCSGAWHARCGIAGQAQLELPHAVEAQDPLILQFDAQEIFEDVRLDAACGVRFERLKVGRHALLRRALALATNPGRFLSTVQIGITLVGVLSGAFSGATFGLRLTEWFVALGLRASVAEALGVGLVVAVITYLSLVIGEPVPKQIALRNPEKIAV